MEAACSLVVYLYIPTSNHNYLESEPKPRKLYIFIFLHQTTTRCPLIKTMPKLYIFIFLHQTTTRLRRTLSPVCCISLYSYIKPQQGHAHCCYRCVVYLYIPTSNHNFVGAIKECPLLYIFIFLHQTTTENFI